MSTLIAVHLDDSNGQLNTIKNSNSLLMNSNSLLMKLSKAFD